jgi:hypothetical protein
LEKRGKSKKQDKGFVCPITGFLMDNQDHFIEIIKDRLKKGVDYETVQEQGFIVS